MEDKHWNDDALVERLYGLGAEDDHLERCTDCRQRWEQILARRQSVLEPQRAPEAFLVAQRQKILARLEAIAIESPTLHFAYALAVAVIFATGIVLSLPTPEPVRSVASSDTQIFEEAFSMASSAEPQALAPIRGLFEARQ